MEAGCGHLEFWGLGLPHNGVLNFVRRPVGCVGMDIGGWVVRPKTLSMTKLPNPSQRGVFLSYFFLTSSSHAERSPPRPSRPSAAPHTSTTSLHASPAFHAKRRSKRRSLSSRPPLPVSSVTSEAEIEAEFDRDGGLPSRLLLLLPSALAVPDTGSLPPDAEGKRAVVCGVASTPPASACFNVCVVSCRVGIRGGGEARCMSSVAGRERKNCRRVEKSANESLEGLRFCRRSQTLRARGLQTTSYNSCDENNIIRSMSQYPLNSRTLYA